MTTTAPETVQAGVESRALAEYARWSTGCDTRRPKERRSWVCRQDEQGVWQETTAHSSEREADDARHKQALNAVLAAALTNPPGGGTDTLREAAQALLQKWDAYQTFDLNYECAYRHLAKSSYSEWNALRTALDAPTTPAPVGDGVEGLRARIEKEIREIRLWASSHECKNAGSDLDTVADNLEAALEATRTPAGAAGDPVGEAAAIWHNARLKACAAPMGDKAVWSDLGAAETALSKAVATRPASQAPAASAGRVGSVDWPRAMRARAEWGARTKHDSEGTTGLLLTAADKLEAALALTAQAQPAGREEIEAFIRKELAVRNSDGSPRSTWSTASVLADAILNARPVADEGADIGGTPEQMTALTGALDDLSRAAEIWASRGGDQAHRVLPLIHPSFSAVFEAYKPLRKTPATAPAAKSAGGSDV